MTQAHRHRHACTLDLYRHDEAHLLRCNVSAPKRDQGLIEFDRVGNTEQGWQYWDAEIVY